MRKLFYDLKFNRNKKQTKIFRAIIEYSKENIFNDITMIKKRYRSKAFSLQMVK